MRNGVAFACLGVAAGLGCAACAAVLGFEDTTLRPDDVDASADDGGRSDAELAETGGEAGTARIQADPSSVVLRRGGTADVSLSVVRGAEMLGALTITVSDLPAGVTAPPATIAAGDAAGKVTLTASADAPFGSAIAHVSIDASGLPPIPLGVLVAGVPGAADVTFGSGGYAVDTTKGGNATFHAVAVQADGKIVAAGAGSTGWLVRRFGADGASDAAFTTALDSLPTDGEIDAVAIDPATQKIVVVGSSSPAIGQAQLTVMRLLPSGAPDATFASGTFRLGGTDSPISSGGLGVTIAPDRSVIVAGTRRDLGGGDSGIALRLKSDGSRDATFAGGKLLVVPANRFVGVALDAAGEILVGGTDTTTAPGSFWLSKRLASGAADVAFGKNGVTTFGIGFRAEGFARLGDGSLVLVGESAQGGNVYTVGRVDASGGQVFVRGVVTGNNASFFGVAGDAMNRIVAAGHTTGGNAEARVSRVLGDGQLDVTFGTGGGTTVTATTLFANAIEPDGRIVVAGNRNGQGAVIVRLWP